MGRNIDISSQWHVVGVSAGQNSMLELSTHLPNERHSEPSPIHTVLSMSALLPNQQGELRIFD